MRPQFLKKGDKVYLLSISRKVDFEIATAIATLENWGLEVIKGSTVTGRNCCQFSGTESERINDLEVALNDPTIKAIFFCKGG